MAAKKKTSKVSEVGVIHCTHNVQSNDWFASAPEDTQKRVNSSFGPRITPPGTLYLPSTKIIVAVAESPTWTEYTSGAGVRKSKKLECGRAAAQAAHAVSKLKLSYVAWLSQKQPGDAYGYAQQIMATPITTIIVKARDSEELYHLIDLARDRNLHFAEFRDENKAFYDCEKQITTAVAMGPYTGCEFNGITDYLPLWKCGCD